VIRRLNLAMVLLLVGATAACGAEEASVLERAFEQEIRTATLDMRLEAAGAAVTLRGPFEDNSAGKLPSFDWKLHAEGLGAGALDARVASSGRNVFVEHGGETYEIGEREVARFQRESRKGGSSQLEDVEDVEDAQRLGLQDWFPKSDLEEDSRVGDEPTTRVTGRLDVSAFSDVDQPVEIEAPASGKPIQKLFERLGGAGDGAGAVSPS